MTWTKSCPACGLDVVYHSLRLECVKCGKWIHGPGPGTECLQRSGECHMCSHGKPNLAPLRKFLLEDVGLDEESLDSGLVLMASVIWCGPDEGRVCELTGLDPEVVRVRADRLRQSWVWGDGVVNVDNDVNLDDIGQFFVWILLATLCADDRVVRQTAEGPCS